MARPTDEERRKQLAKARENALKKHVKGQRAQRAAREQRTQEQKDKTSRTLKDKKTMRAAVRGDAGKKTDGKILSHGFEAQTKGPERMAKLKDRQQREARRLALAQQRQRRAQTLKGKARDGFNQSGKDGYTGYGR